MRIIVTGGGTGGHVYPALAFISYLKKVTPSTEVLYIGTEKGLESKIVPQAGLSFETIDVQGLKRSMSPQNIKTIFKFVKSTTQAKKIIKDFRPDIVLGTGGYVSAPVIYGASRLNIPTVIHEQNSIPGMTNKFLSRFATKIAVGFQEAANYFPEEKTHFTGNPRSQEIADIDAEEAISEFGMLLDKKTVLIFGGSRGALKINQAMVEALPKFVGKNYQVIYASGEIYYDEFKEVFEKYNIEPNIAIRPYIENMSEVMSNADILVSRAGATTLAEVTSLGIPSILIPSPYVTADHQTKNAEALKKSGAALIITDAELTGDKIVKQIERILDDGMMYRNMSDASMREGVLDSSVRLLKVINRCLE